VLELFFQVFDKGNMEDGEGRSINFKTTSSSSPTNACTDQLMKLVADPENRPQPTRADRHAKARPEQDLQAGFSRTYGGSSRTIRCAMRH